MPVMDEFKEERAALKHGTPKEKWNYFLDYYKWHVIVGIAVIAMAVSLISQILSRKDTIFYAVMINGIEGTAVQEYKEAFAEYAGLDLDGNDILFDTTIRAGSGDPNDVGHYNPDALASGEKLMIYIASSEVDVFVTDRDTLQQYVYNEFLLDLRELLTPEQIAAYEPYFYYADQAVIAEKNAAEDAMNYDYVPVYPDPLAPDTMKEPVPVGICIPDSSSLRENFLYAREDLVLGVVVNSKRKETASLFIDYIMQ